MSNDFETAKELVADGVLKQDFSKNTAALKRTVSVLLNVEDVDVFMALFLAIGRKADHAGNNSIEMNNLFLVHARVQNRLQKELLIKFSNSTNSNDVPNKYCEMIDILLDEEK